MQKPLACERFSEKHPYDLGPYVDEHYAFLRHVLARHPRPGNIALEFGVGCGNSTRIIAAHMPVIGFDSFTGLPEDWREGFPAGMFACPPPSIEGVHLVIGSFEDRLPDFVRYSSSVKTVGLVHIDCDLYSSTRTVLDNIRPFLRPGCLVVFDEWHGYEGCEQHEQRAWHEFADAAPIQWEVIGHSFQQWGIQIV